MPSTGTQTSKTQEKPEQPGNAQPAGVSGHTSSTGGSQATGTSQQASGNSGGGNNAPAQSDRASTVSAAVPKRRR